MDQAHSWILPQYSQLSWWKKEKVNSEHHFIIGHVKLQKCSDEEIAKALQSVIFIDTLKYNTDAEEKRDPNTYYLVKRPRFSHVQLGHMVYSTQMHA